MSHFPKEGTAVIGRMPVAEQMNYERMNHTLVRWFGIKPAQYLQRFKENKQAGGIHFETWVNGLLCDCNEWVRGMEAKDCNALNQLMVTERLEEEGQYILNLTEKEPEKFAVLAEKWLAKSVNKELEQHGSNPSVKETFNRLVPNWRVRSRSISKGGQILQYVSQGGSLQERLSGERSYTSCTHASKCECG